MPTKTKEVQFPPAPVRQKNGDVTVFVQAETFTPDGVQYKPYSVHMRFTSPVCVGVNVPAKEVVSFEDGNLVLTQPGLYLIAKQLASASMAVAQARN